MGWFIRSSRNGLHMVYGQQASNSCGIACVMMVNFKMKKWQLAAALTTAPAGGAAVPAIGFNIASAIKLESQVDAAYAKATGKPYDGSTDTRATQLPKVLNNLGIGEWIAECYTGGNLADKIISYAGTGAAPAPVILLVHWRSGGGHFVVCDTVVQSGGQTYADMCDPWDTSVRTVALSKGGAVVYDVDKADDLIDLGRSHNTYNPATGDIDGWIIHRVGG